MDIEVIKAIGQWIVSPMCVAVIAWAFFHYMSKD